MRISIGTGLTLRETEALPGLGNSGPAKLSPVSRENINTSADNSALQNIFLIIVSCEKE